MGAELRLGRLPKSSLLKSLNFRRTTPGQYLRLINPRASAGKTIIDPSHPLTKLKPETYWKKLPYFQSPEFSLRAFPTALLTRPDMLRPDPPYSPAKEPPPKNTLNMSLRFTIPLRIHKSSFVRSKIRTRLKTGISLIVIRGACVEVDAEGKKRLISQDDGEDEKKWIMKDWTYVFSPSLEVYRMPYVDMIERLRKALSAVNKQGTLLEATWTVMLRQGSLNLRNDKRR